MKKQPKRKLTPKQKKQQRIFFGVLIGIVIIALIIHFRRKQANPTEIQSEIAQASNSVPTPAAPQYSSSGLRILGNTATLKKGTKSAEVRWVQWDFNNRIAKPNGWTLLSEDGIFGAKTEYAVNSVMKKKTTSWAEWKTKVDGIISNKK